MACLRWMSVCSDSVATRIYHALNALAIMDLSAIGRFSCLQFNANSRAEFMDG